ncbi:MAG: adenine phosphoribosyltransferase [Phascolarctobacterium sp.]|nr:adenine phosphoribosyltransferase [Phascolarctobacterium sp.]
MDYKKYVADYPDFPEKGIIFRDVSPLLADPRAFNSLLNQMAEAAYDMGDFDTVVGLDARGFVFGAALASRTHCPFIMIRKKGKLPQGDLVEATYDLEYGKATMQMHGTLIKGKKVIIVDDVMATGGTAKAAMDLVEAACGKVVGIITPCELTFLNGRKKIGAVPFASFIKY